MSAFTISLNASTGAVAVWCRGSLVADLTHADLVWENKVAHAHIIRDALADYAGEKPEQIDWTPPNRDERDWERGGFARQGRKPGRAGWEEEI